MNNKQKGNILVMVLLMLVTFVVIMVAWAGFASQQAHKVTSYTEEEAAYNIAEAGVDFVMFALDQMNVRPSDFIDITDDDGDEWLLALPVRDPEDGETRGRYVLTFTGDSETLHVTSVGYPTNNITCQEIDATIHAVRKGAGYKYYIRRMVHDTDAECEPLPDCVFLYDDPRANFDGNLVVDAEDFMIWQTNFGGPGGHNQGDADGDGWVDGDDFLIWQAEFCG